MAWDVMGVAMECSNLSRSFVKCLLNCLSLKRACRGFFFF